MGMVLMYFTLLEGCNNFERGEKEALPLANCPEAVTRWIHAGRKVVPHAHLKVLTGMAEE